MIKHRGKTDLPSNYTYFFDLLGNHLIASFDGANEKGELSISQRRGIMNELPVIGYPCYPLPKQLYF